MGIRTNNLKAFFNNPRTRLIYIITFLFVILGIVIGYFILRERMIAPQSNINLVNAPQNIQNAPGTSIPSPQYEKLLEQENLQKAIEAKKTGTSAIPTIIRESNVGQGQLAQLPNIASNLTPLQMALNNLTRNACDPKSLAEAIKLGAKLVDLKEAGCTANDLIASGFTPQQLEQAGFSACDLLSSNGIDPKKLKQAGFSAGELRGVGFNACQLKKAGFTAAQLQAAGFTPEELKGVGFSPTAIAAAGYSANQLTEPKTDRFYPGLPLGMTAAYLKQQGCNPEAIAKARASGISATTLRKISGCSAKDLKMGGYSVSELKTAGYSAGDLKSAGFTPIELKNAGFSADDLRKAGFSAKDLKNSGFTAEQLKKAGFTAGELKNAGYSTNALKQAGFTPDELLEAGYTSGDLKKAGLSNDDIAKAINQLKKQLPKAAFERLEKIDCSADAVKKAREEKISATIMRKMGCSATELKAGGYTANELKDAGFTAGELKDAGFTANELKNAGYNANQLKDAGFTATDLKNAGFTAEQLKKAGFTPGELNKAGFSLDNLKKAGFTAAQLRNAGFTAKQLKDAGFSPNQLKDAGFSAAELKDAGFNAKQLKDLGYSAHDLKDAGFSTDELKAAGFKAAELRDAGFNASQLKNAGFSANELRDAGFQAQDLKNAGFHPDELKKAGYSNQDLLNAGYNNADLGGTSKPTSSFPSQGSGALNQTAQQQMNEIQRQQLQSLQQQMQSTITSQAGQLFSAWKPSTFSYEESSEQNDSSSVMAQVGKLGTGNLNNNTSIPMIKAGTIYFAVLDTAVNSDEPGPILATIVSGKFKGAKLIGRMTTFGANAQKVMLQFNSMTLNNYPSSMAISAVAIDPDTARTGLSSDTDNHYLLRYGTLFASAFLEGYGQALLSANAQTVTTLFSVITINQSLSPADQFLVALGNVGNRFGQQLQPIFNTPPTVQVYSGTGVGILFTQDIHQPETV